MPLMSGKIIPAVAVAACLLASVNPAFAQTNVMERAAAKAEAAIGKIKNACAGDIDSFCSKVTPGEGRMALCMMAHEDKISDRCFGALFDVADALDLALGNLARAADVCEADIDRLCGEVREGEGRIGQCLVDNKAKLSTPCRAEVTSMEVRLGK